MEEADDEHDFACGGDAYEQMAHHAAAFAQVEEGKLLPAGQFAHEVADFVGGVFLQPAFFYGHDFVESTCAVEAQYVFAVADFGLGQLFSRQPAAVGEGVFHFVAVEDVGFGGQDGEEFSGFYLANALEDVAHAFFFVAQLGLVGQMLIGAASTTVEVFAKGLYAFFRHLPKGDHKSLPKSRTSLFDEHVHHIAGSYAAFYKNDAPLGIAPHAFALVGQAGDEQILYDLLFSLASHKRLQK